MKKVKVNFKGFPGWHAECTAMGCKYLGKQFDLHTGGIDHIPIHHTNEIAQAEGAYGQDHVKYWLHSEFLTVGNNEKMAKSAGNFLRMQTLIDKGYHPLDYRYFLLLTHYRKAVAFSWEALDAAKTARERLMDKVAQLKEEATPVADLSKERLAWQSRFITSINDDLNTPQAVALVHEVLKSDLAAGEKLSLLLDWDTVLGLHLKAAHKEEVVVPQEVQKLVAKRQLARDQKDWALSDTLRDDIHDMGYSVSDTPAGPVVEKL